jgi:hypothetical protein
VSDIFLSYARENESTARLIATALEWYGWSVWWDRHIPHGQNFRAYIQQQLDEARCVIVLWSNASVASPFVCEEADEGRTGSRLIPAAIEHVQPPIGFRQLHAADLTDWRGQRPHDDFDRLVTSIELLMRRPVVAARPVGEPPQIAALDSATRHNVSASPIYISSGPENRVAVEKLHAAIRSFGGDAWFYSGTLGSDEWQNDILPRIGRDIRLFVPVISHKTTMLNESYVFKEWREALEARSKSETGRPFILPIVVDTDFLDVRPYLAWLADFQGLRDRPLRAAPGGEPDEATRGAFIRAIRLMLRDQ